MGELSTIGWNEGKLSWRRWLFDQAHNTFLNPHRTVGETFQIVRCMGYWESLAKDCDDWYLACKICQQHRAQGLRPPTRSLLADDAHAVVLLWLDVIIDMQGPYTKAEGGRAVRDELSLYPAESSKALRV